MGTPSDLRRSLSRSNVLRKAASLSWSYPATVLRIWSAVTGRPTVSRNASRLRTRSMTRCIGGPAYRPGPANGRGQPGVGHEKELGLWPAEPASMGSPRDGTCDPPTRTPCPILPTLVASERSDQFVHPLVHGAEGVLAEHRPLGLVVELQVHPVDGEVAVLGLRGLDEVAAETRPCRLRGLGESSGDVLVGDHTFHEAPALEEVIQPAVLGDPVALAAQVHGILLQPGQEVLPHLDGTLDRRWKPW